MLSVLRSAARRLIPALTLAAGLLPWRALALVNPDEITVYAAAFEGPGALGRNVATILQLQLWHSFRRMPWPENPERHDFGPAVIVWDAEPLAELDHASAEAAARRANLLAQMVVWGRAYPYGGGVAVQANITLPAFRDLREANLEKWRVELAGEAFEVDVPRRRFEVSSIVLDAGVVAKYSLPSALEIHSARHGGELLGSVGPDVRALQFEPDLAYVRSGDVAGWVRLPELSRRRSELVEVAAGIVRIYRGDFEGAIASFTRVLDNPNTRTPLRIDALLYRGMARQRLGRSGRDDFLRAYELSPFAQTTVRYLIMADLAALARGDLSPAAAAALRDRLRSTIDRERYLFAPDDAWLQRVEGIL
jgi:hypothetical protein